MIQDIDNLSDNKPKLYSLYTMLMLYIAMVACVRSDLENSPRPNIVFIMGDDHTTQAISAYGGHLSDYAQTHHIDSLAADGFLFRNAFCTNAICSPSRATILTGQFSHQNGVRLLGERFDSSQFTFPQALQSAGYQTGLFGKWHLKSRPTGFDQFKVLQVQGRYRDPQFVESETDSLVTYLGWSTDIITDHSIHFLKSLKRDQPFMLLTHYKATHDPWASRIPYDTLWQHTVISEPPNLLDTYAERSVAAQRTTLKLEFIDQRTFPHDRLDTDSLLLQRKHIYQQYIKAFLRCGKVLDENVGRLIQYLKKEDLYDQSLIIYTADQGHFLGEHGFFSKRFMYDEAMRIPLIIKMPGQQTASALDQMVINADLAPTLLEFAKVSIPKETQGRSVLPILRGNPPEDWRTRVYYHYWQHLLHRDVAAHIGIRTLDHKLIFYYGLPMGLTSYNPTTPEWEFFDLRNDPNEMNNLIAKEDQQLTIQLLKQQLLGMMNDNGVMDMTPKEFHELIEKEFKSM